MNTIMTDQTATTPPPSVAPIPCGVCGSGHRKPGTTTITVDRGSLVLVFRHVPASVCDNCESAIVDVDVARELERQVAAAVAAGVTTDVRDYQVH